ncbi:Putative rep protein [Halobaculum gomorrense]|uniref:Putative rep protein n=1 Tax=Halobaculum gomorrense TaxID=43928 RepID=A0A1M5RD95_9EURY|nr:Putative rep protein [Halobaculum gomorrense]
MSSDIPSAGDAPTPTSGASWPSKETNSVTPATPDSAGNSVLAIVHERVSEFRREYPKLADLPLSRSHGRSLRRIVTEAEWADEWVEPDTFGESAFCTTSLVKREAGTWADALAAFLTAHLDYDGMFARFSNGEDSFELPLTDAWGKEYHAKQYARARALERQMGGGERPSGGEAVAAWDRPATAMITLSASSTPNGDRLSPVDHLDAVHDSFSYDGVRDTLRNVMEYHLGLDSDQWGYWLQAEPHGLGDGSGVNACYTHIHVGTYLDAAGLDAERIGSELERVIDKHLDVCEPAGKSAHDYDAIDSYQEEDDGCISVNMEVGNLGSYLAAYMGGSYDERLEERPIEYLAWGTLYWSTARQRTTRSQTVNQAIAADACQQRAESESASQSKEHGESVRWSEANGSDVVCRCCGSGWAIDQSRMSKPVFDDDLRAVLPDGPPNNDSPPSLDELWADARAAGRAGESLARARTRDRVTRWIDAHPSASISPVALLGRLDIHPTHIEFVADLLNGSDTGPESKGFTRPDPLEPEWELEAIIDADGEEHTPGDGGVDMVTLHLPEKQIREETRLSKPLASGETWRCGKCNFATHNPRMMAGHLVAHGLEDPEAADHVLMYHPLSKRRDPREAMQYAGERPDPPEQRYY